MTAANHLRISASRRSFQLNFGRNLKPPAVAELKNFIRMHMCGVRAYLVQCIC